jgi:transposase
VAQLGLHHDTVEAVIEKHRFGSAHNRQGSSLPDTYKPFIQQTLENYPRLRATRLHEMLRDRGYSGSVHPVRRYVRRTRPITNREAFFRLASSRASRRRSTGLASVPSALGERCASSPAFC